MGELYLAADAAYPFDYARLPRKVKVFLGYVGDVNGTPHVWTQAEVDAVRATGRVWAPIWTPPEGRLDAAIGARCAAQMSHALQGYTGLEGCPVFYDIEKHVYDADPAGARASWEAWQTGMHHDGHPQAWPYLPGGVGYGWAANWTGVRPTELPPGLIGWQYEGSAPHPGYDLSVVARSVFDPWINSQKGRTVALSRADRKFIVAQLQRVQDNVLHKLQGIYRDGWEGHPHPANLVDIRSLLEAVAQSVGHAGGPGVDPAALAQAIAAQLGPELAGQVADELHRRLAHRPTPGKA